METENNQNHGHKLIKLTHKEGFFIDERTLVFLKWGRVLEMPKIVCGGDIFHVMAFA